MFKNYWFAILFLIALYISGCNVKMSYDFLKDASEVECIEIVDVTENFMDGQAEQIVICTVEDSKAFMQELNELNCYLVLGDPIGIESRKTAIKIIYSDGEYDLITYNGRATYTYERQYQNYKGHRYFDKEEFEAFLQKYIGDETQSSD